jgi:hypothetical protein
MGTTKARRRERYAQGPDYRAKQRAYARAYYHSHKQDIKPILRRSQLKRQYGISPADYDALLAKQDGVCATCGKPSEETLCVDHCHETGTIRGLLCRQCNFALGCFRESQAAMMAAIAYLGGSKDDRTGAAAQRALAARAALLPGRAGMAVRIDARSLNRLDSDPTPAGDSAMKPMRNVLDAQLRREGDDGEGRKAKILQLIARKLAPGRSPATSRRSRKSSTAWMDHRSRPRLRTSRREGHAEMARSVKPEQRRVAETSNVFC